MGADDDLAWEKKKVMVSVSHFELFVVTFFIESLNNILKLS